VGNYTRYDPTTAWTISCERALCPVSYESEAWNELDAQRLAREHDEWHKLIEKPLPPGSYDADLMNAGVPFAALETYQLVIQSGPQKGRVIWNTGRTFEVPEFGGDDPAGDRLAETIAWVIQDHQNHGAYPSQIARAVLKVVNGASADDVKLVDEDEDLDILGH